MRTNKASTDLPVYRSIVDRNSVRKSINTNQNYTANRITLDTRYMAKPPID